MRCGQDQVAIAVYTGALALRLTAPEHEYDRPLPVVDNFDDPIRESLPALPLVRARPTAFHREHGVEQQHSVVGPRLKAPMARNDEPQVVVQFLEDVDQRRRNANARPNREAKSVPLTGPVVGVLA